jgi:hypothetical protein
VAKKMNKTQRNLAHDVMASTISSRRAPYADAYPEHVLEAMRQRGWVELRDDDEEPYQRVYITPRGTAAFERSF